MRGTAIVLESSVSGRWKPQGRGLTASLSCHARLSPARDPVSVERKEEEEGEIRVS